MTGPETIFLATSFINAWNSGKTRQSSESLSAATQNSSKEIALLSQNHSRELQYKQLKVSILQQRFNHDFQREVAELSHERALEIESYRAEVNFAINQKNLDFQRWRFEQEKKIQYDILKAQQSFQRELSSLQQQQALLQLRERLREDKSPIANLASDLLENSFAQSTIPLKVILSPPCLDFDPSAGKPYQAGYEGFLSNEIENFLYQGYLNSEQSPVQLVDKSWETNKHGGGSALQSLHAQLKSIPVLVLDSEIALGELNFRVGYWAGGDVAYKQATILSRESVSSLLNQIARQLASEWQITRQKLKDLGKDDAFIKGMGGIHEENLQITQREQSAKEELIQKGIDISALSLEKDYKIIDQHYKHFYEYLAVWHCLVIGHYADQLFLARSWRNTPLLPSLIPYLMQKYDGHPLLHPEFWHEAISGMIKAYVHIYDSLANEASSHMPELRIKLGFALCNLPMKFYHFAYEQAYHALSDWLSCLNLPADKVFNSEEEDFQLLKTIIHEEDQIFLHDLQALVNQLGEQVGINPQHKNVIISFLSGWQRLQLCGPFPSVQERPLTNFGNTAKLQDSYAISINSEMFDIPNQFLEATKIRQWFADQFEQMRQILISSEGTDGGLALTNAIESLNNEAKKLKDSKFRIMVLGDFNRGKSTILNVLLGKELLPMGVTPTTSIPTHIIHGTEESVKVYKKDGSTETMKIQDYREKYTLNSNYVKRMIKKLASSVGNWLSTLERAEIQVPNDLLSRGVEFIDTAGLNSSDAEDKKTLSYISSCDAVLFVLSGSQQLTDKEQFYINTHVRDKVGHIFFLINYSDNLDSSDYDEIHDAFIDRFTECLTSQRDVVERMWGQTIFDIQALVAFKNLNNEQSLAQSGFTKFNRKLDEFLIHKQLVVKLFQPLQSVESIANLVVSNIDNRLLVLNDGLSTLEKKIETASPHMLIMKKVTKNLSVFTQKIRCQCVDQVELAYVNYFTQVCKRLPTDFPMPVPTSLDNSQKETYRQLLITRLGEYWQVKIEEWEKICSGIVKTLQVELINFFNEEEDEYKQQREKIKEILQGDDFGQRGAFSKMTSPNAPTFDPSLPIANNRATHKELIAGTAAAAGTGIAGLALAGTAHAALLTGGIGTILSFTPVGWGIIGVSVLSGAIAALWGRSSEIKNFQQEMLKNVQSEFEKTLDPDKVDELKNSVANSFLYFERRSSQFTMDVDSMELSLKNRLESRHNSVIDLSLETSKLDNLRTEITSRWAAINEKYKQILATSK